jgi:carbon storage regulator
MLILSRKAEQTIQIGEQIRVTILSIRGTRVTIGLEAPDSVRILCGELESFGEPLGSQPGGEDVVKRRPFMAP